VTFAWVTAGAALVASAVAAAEQPAASAVAATAVSALPGLRTVFLPASSTARAVSRTARALSLLRDREHRERSRWSRGIGDKGPGNDRAKERSGLMPGSGTVRLGRHGFLPTAPAIFSRVGAVTSCRHSWTSARPGSRSSRPLKNRRIWLLGRK